MYGCGTAFLTWPAPRSPSRRDALLHAQQLGSTNAFVCMRPVQVAFPNLRANKLPNASACRITHPRLSPHDHSPATISRSRTLLTVVRIGARHLEPHSSPTFPPTSPHQPPCSTPSECYLAGPPDGSRRDRTCRCWSSRWPRSRSWPARAHSLWISERCVSHRRHCPVFLANLCC